MASVIPAVTGAMPARAARVRGDDAIASYPAVSATVIAAAGTSMPPTAAATPRHPATR